MTKTKITPLYERLSRDTVNRGEVIPGKLCAQFHKQRSLPRRQFPAVKVKPVRNLDAAAIPTTYRFDGSGKLSI